MSLTIYEGRIPKSGKKLINLGGIDFFIREAARLTYVYLQESGELIMVSGNGRQVALQQLLERISLVRDYIKTREGSSL